MEKKKKTSTTTNQPPTIEEFENTIRSIMFNRPPTLKQIREMNKAKRESKKKKM